MTARHAPPPRHRIAAASEWADNLPHPCKWATFLTAVALCALGLGVPFVGGLNTQAQAAADEHLALTVERPAEPVGHGGPLAPLSIGVVAPETDVPVVPPIVRSSRHVVPRTVPGTPVHAPTPVRASTESPPTAVAPNPVTATPTSTSTEETSPWPTASAGASGPDSPKPTAPSVTSTSPPSPTSTATDPEATVSDPTPSPTDLADWLSSLMSTPMG